MGVRAWAVVLCLVFPIAAHTAEEEISDFDELDLEELLDVVFSASKHEQSIFWSPSAITVFTREDIRSSGANSLTDLLRRVPGFDVYEMKPSFPLVGARALTDISGNLVLLLVDGREALVELSGWPLWAAMTIDLEEIERIEVIRGPGSTLYGANAFAGVVSITTVSDQAPDTADILLSAGEEGQRRLFGRIRQGWEAAGGRLDFSAGLGTEERRSSSDRRDVLQENHLRAHGVLHYRRDKKLDLSLHGGAIYGNGAMFMLTGDFQGENVLNHYVMGKAAVGLAEGLNLKAQVYHIYFYSDFHCRNRFTSRGIWMADLPDMFVDTNTVDGQVQIDYHAADGLLLIGGGNLRYTNQTSDRILPHDLDEFRGAGFVHAQWSPLEVFQLTGGVRLDWNDKTEDAFSPRAVAVFRPWATQAFRLGYGLAFRKPAAVENQWHLDIEDAAFPEVIEKLRTAVGNEELVNEKVHSFEAGWRGRFLDERLRVAVDLFYNIYKDMIYFKTEMIWEMGRPNILDSTFQFLNQPEKIHAAGGEIEVTFAPTQSTAVWGNLGLRRVVEEDGQPVASEPIIRANLGCWWRSRLGLVVDLAFHYVSSYEMAVVLPEEPFDVPVPVGLGNNLLVIGRVGYSLTLGTGRALEAGLTVRAPLGPPVLEFPGYPVRRSSYSVTVADFGGEMIVRLVSFYLRGSF